jgi:uncharacterized membrane protein YfcA
MPTADLPLLGLVLAVAIGVSLGFFGGGGSILTVPLLVYVFGQEPKLAIAGSLLIVGTTSIFAAVQHARAGNVRLREGLLFGVAGMTGAYGGGRASAYLDGGFLLLLFAAMMVLTSFAMWRGRKGGGETVEPGPGAVAKLLLQGLAVGAFTGLVGAGGGFLIVPALALWAGLPMAVAVGTSLMVIVMKSGAAFLGYVNHVSVDYSTAAAITLCAIVGSFAGSRLARVVDPASLRRAFAGFVLAMACLILVREGALVTAAVSDALPSNIPQILFALVMLAIGALAGRSSRKAADRSSVDLTYQGGAGI